MAYTAEARREAVASRCAQLMVFLNAISFLTLSPVSELALRIKSSPYIL